MLARLQNAWRHSAGEGADASFLRRLSCVLRRACNKRWTALWMLRSLSRSARAGCKRRLAQRPGRSNGARFPNSQRSISEQPPPAFDLRMHNPIHWPREVGDEVAALGPLDLLPPGAHAHRVVGSGDPLRLRRHRHVEDAPAFHADLRTRAGRLARLAAAGVVLHAADADCRLRALLGGELYGLVTADPSPLDADARELRSIRMRRAALREHSSWASEAANLPFVSILLATRRPPLLPQALAAVASQTYPRLELVLALHGKEESFANAQPCMAGLGLPVKLVRAPENAPLGAVLNAAVQRSAGELLTKMDDDDWYGADHLWDLVLARQYSRAKLVGKGIEFVYLAASNQTLHCHSGRGEAWRASSLAGGALLIARRDLDRIGGWRNAPQGIDEALVNDVLRAGGSVYRTHGAGFMLVRHGCHHAWNPSDGYFRARADRIIPGCAPAVAAVEGPPPAS